jgi:hypothetical protein
MRSRLLLIPAALVVAAPATAHEYLTLQQAQAQFFPGEKLKKQSVKLNDAEVAAIMKLSGVGVYRREVNTWRSKSGDLMVLDQVLGRQDVITYVVVFDAQGAVKAVEVLVCESGYEGVRAPAWLAQFVGKSAETMKVLSSPSIISGTTLSCVNIAEGIMRLIATYKIALNPGG